MQENMINDSKTNKEKPTSPNYQRRYIKNVGEIKVVDEQ